MVKLPYMGSSRTKASLIYHSKVHLIHRKTEGVAIAELRVWKIPKNSDYPEGIKYSLYLVSKESKEVLIGMDNHKPKGHHLHRGDREEPYNFSGIDKLIEDFWTMVTKEGFLI